MTGGKGWEKPRPSLGNTKNEFKTLFSPFFIWTLFTLVGLMFGEVYVYEYMYTDMNVYRFVFK